jgi:hypothetical protein
VFGLSKSQRMAAAEIQARTRFTRYDKFLIIGLLIVALLGLCVVRYRAGGTDTVVVQVDGEEVIRASLADDRRFSVDGPLGRTEIEIKDKRVRVIDSPCSRKICVHTGWIGKPYQTIICIPNRVVIRLLSSDDKDKLDAITG